MPNLTPFFKFDHTKCQTNQASQGQTNQAIKPDNYLLDRSVNDKIVLFYQKSRYSKISVFEKYPDIYIFLNYLQLKF